ncbi:MAG: hypothetical protein IPH84_13030 [Bacteroidales bacterium]|nr:hypothetical protein [Bacteroidales bacterium]
MNLKVGGDLDLKQDTTFLKALFIGEKSLFFLLDKNKKEQFYIPIDTGYDLLIYKRYLKNTGQEMRPGEGSQIIENARYKGQLLNYMKDCNSIVPMISKTAYTQKDLFTLFDSYYKCVPSGIKYKSTQEKVSTKYSILAGMSMTTMNFKSDMYKVLRQTEFSPSYNLYVGFRFDFIFPRNFNKWSAGIELGNSSYKFNGIHNEYESAQVYTITETNISASYLKINSILNYSEFFGKYKATWDLGYSYGRAYNLTNLQTKETKIYTTERTESIPAINEIRRFEQGLLFGMSLKYSFFSVGLRYEGGNGFSNSSNIGTRTNRFYGLLIFTFK